MWKYTGSKRPDFAVSPAADQESVWDYPRPPAVVRDGRRVTVGLRQIEIANTCEAIRLCETASPPTFYVPPQCVRVELLRRSETSSYCEWKGRASYWSLAIPGEPLVVDVGWSYEEPRVQYQAIRGHFSFFPARVECRVGGRLVEPQPGDFYGGWVTPDVVGPFKGEPGTSGW